MIKIEFPADDKVAAGHLGRALLAISGQDLYADGSRSPRLDDGLNNEGDAIDNSEGPQPGDRGGIAESPKHDLPDEALSDAYEENAPRDAKGVPFNEGYCARAEQPFNTTGPKAGQWKKKRGLSEQQYDDWYAAELAKIVPTGSGEETVPPVDTAAAFGAPAAPSLFDGPKDTGALMHWVSEKQVAGALTQDHVNQAFVTAGLTMADLFNKDAETLAANVGRVYAELVKVAR